MGQPIRDVGERVVECGGERGVRVGAESMVDAGMALRQFGRVDIDLNDDGVSSPLLPVESGLLQTETTAKDHDEIGTVEEEVGGPLPPRVRPSDVYLVDSTEAIGAVPRRHGGNTGAHEIVVDCCRGGSANAAAEQPHRSLRFLHELGDSPTGLDAGLDIGRSRADGSERVRIAYEGRRIDRGALRVETELEKNWARSSLTTGSHSRE